ncbi:MAG: hypothetical protein H7326_11545 [Bdellovibrionaceae bacterium]|nr:hypothetical protein [Pseudobdellovibrionaceae bacterium]
MALFGIGFSVLVALFALRRASKIFFWLRLDGVVVGPLDGVGATSAVVIKFTDPEGNAREFPSSITFGHRYRAPFGERIPYSPGDRVSILVNPRNYLEADLNSPLLIVIPVLLLLLSAALATTLL